MLPAKLSLWKKQGNKWYRYNASFRASDKNHLMQAARLIRSGWLPFPDVSKVSDKSEPLDIGLFDIDTRPLDELVGKLTPWADRIPSNWYETIMERHKEASKKEIVIEVIEEVSSNTEQRVMSQAIEAYNRGEKLPPFLMRRVMKALF